MTEYKSELHGDTTDIVMEQEEYEAYKDAQQHPQLSLYELNKQAVKKLPKMDKSTIKARLKKQVSDWYHSYATPPKYIMLLCAEQNYYTVFHDVNNRGYTAFALELLDILTNWYGDNDIRAIETHMIDDKPVGSIEIWGMWKGSPSVAYLFPYDEGVVEY